MLEKLLFYKIRGQNFTTGDGCFSVTREVYYYPSLKNNNIILDFPGLNSSVEVVKHLKTQKNV